MSAILSTSGSTGFPKGAIFTEDLLIPTDAFTLISPFIRIDYQPFDPVLLLSLMSTIRYGSMRGLTNLKDMWDDIRDIKPTSLGLSPVIWNTLYKTYSTKLTGLSTDVQRENVAREMRESLGGRLIVGTSGGGSISSTVLSFIWKELQIDLVDMYGCRECGNISRDGVIYPGVNVKVIPVPDMELDGVEEGEICIHSSRMISGYWGMAKYSSFIELEGKRYYRTGDIGKLHQGMITLFDRSGTMIKNSMAEWMSPVKIENILEQLLEISSAFVLGDSGCSYVAVIVCPSQSGSTLNETDMLQLIRSYSDHCSLSGPEIPQRIYIERDIIWNETNGLMKEKKCRSALLKHYSEIKTHLFSQEGSHEGVRNSDLSAEFIGILEEILNRSLQGQINGENTLVEIGGDSLSIAQICRVYNERGISLKARAVYSHQLHHLDEMLIKKRLIYHDIMEDIDWKKEYRLPNHIKTLIGKPKSIQNKNIFVIGSTGFLGPLLVSEIVKKIDHNVIVYCLIRATDAEHAQQRLEEEFHKCSRYSTIDWTRIRCIVGDVAKENLGLTLELYNELLEDIGLVYHNASLVNMQMPYKALRERNVTGTLHCLEFALKCHARFVYTSSTTALPASEGSAEDSNGWVNLTSNEMNLKDGYGQTKVVVEQLLHTAFQLGADIVVIRPCTISADTQTGYSNPLDFINLLLLAEVEMGAMVENANIKLHCVPVDYCSRAMVALAMHPDSSGKCFNFYGNGLSISFLHQALIDRLPGVIQHQIVQSSWKQYVLNNLSNKSRTWPLRERIASMIFTSEDRRGRESHVRTERTREFLRSKCGLDWFKVTEQDLRKSIEYMIRQGFLSRQLSLK
jgi:fatty acid CoA ligase FadD9